MLRIIQEERATTMSLVPTMANAILNCPTLGSFDLSSLRQVHLGGAASTPELIGRLEKAFGCPVMSGYGLTETSPVATSARDKSTVMFADEADRIRRRAMTGWPLPGCEMRVVDPEMRDVPRDMTAIGEIVIRGDLVMDGYYKEPQATADVMTNGWLHTGDMAVWDEESYALIVDRKKDIIISRRRKHLFHRSGARHRGASGRVRMRRGLLPGRAVGRSARRLHRDQARRNPG